MKYLNQQEFDSFSFFEMTPDLVCIAGKNGFFTRVNKAVIKTLGYTKTQLLSRPIHSFMHPDDRDRTLARRTELLNGEHLTNFQNRYVAKNGTIIWLQWTSVYIPDKEIIFAIAKDITVSKKNELAIEEKYLKFKKLATGFKQRIEKDRKYFGVELQEQLAQLAVVIKMSVASISATLPDADGPLKEKIDHAMVVSGLLITTIKRIILNIGPYVLDNLGLQETLQWFCKEFTILYNKPCQFSSKFDENELTQEMKIDFFRICQESLSNVIRHADATSVKVSIVKKGTAIVLSVADNGKGFQVKDRYKTQGLITMQQLATSIDATFSIKSKPGKGTTVSVAVESQR